MTWNHRVVKKIHKYKTKDGKTHQYTMYGIHEVFYNNKGVPENVTKDPVNVSSEYKKDLKEILEQMSRAIEKPILKYEDF